MFPGFSNQRGLRNVHILPLASYRLSAEPHKPHFLICKNGKIPSRVVIEMKMKILHGPVD